jgi:hypothetical protein
MERRIMKYILIALSLIALPITSKANFSGMVFIESPVAPVENMIDDILRDTKVDERLSSHPTDLKNLKKALLKGCTTDRDILIGLVKMRNKMLPEIKKLPLEERQKEYDENLAYIKTTALEFGYKEQDQ